MNWPPYTVIRYDPSHRQKLAEWLAEWELDRKLRDPGDAEETRSDQTHIAKPSLLRYDQSKHTICTGDVCLLKPSVGTGHEWGPVYVMVLASIDAAHYLAAPFGRFSTPAVPGEWSTGLNVPALRVLCLWNTRLAAGYELQWIKPAARLPKNTVRDAWHIYQHIREGLDIPERMVARLGPPVIHPGDPRHEYLAEERDRMNDHLVPHSDVAPHHIKDERVEWLMAAEDPEEYDPEE